VRQRIPVAQTTQYVASCWRQSWETDYMSLDVLCIWLSQLGLSESFDIPSLCIWTRIEVLIPLNMTQLSFFNTIFQSQKRCSNNSTTEYLKGESLKPTYIVLYNLFSHITPKCYVSFDGVVTEPPVHSCEVNKKQIDEESLNKILGKWSMICKKQHKSIWIKEMYVKRSSNEIQ
jgi:hypothetical protein